MRERYNVIKILYPNYLILIRKKDKLVSCFYDLLIMKTFDITNTNKIILNNLDIESIEEYEDNNYEELLVKIKIIEILKKYKECMNEKKNSDCF